ncbi:MAG TPA: protein kinase, partial [Candidatus Udaeobacter sp.]|nr:protein kinase [Candidatus Udaeobacter sp.]
MKNSWGLSDSVAGVSESPAKCRHCGATTRLGNGLCLSCTLREGLEGDSESSRESFEAILAEDEVRDTHWRVGNYEILEEIGRGGMGVIYRARQRHSRRIVALKRMVSYHADSRETLERFRREAEAAASLDHPNILPIYEVGQSEDGLPFFSMKYAAGGSLQKAEPALRNEPRECVRLTAKVARAVQYAHEHGVLHRDLKPGNILLDGRGEPFVTDFGLAKWLDTTTDLTRSLAIFGTPGYIAPEQAKGPAAKLTPVADVYSLGAILFDLFTGRPPFLGEHALAVIQQATESPAPKLRSVAPTLDRDLETICARCLEREPQARYRSAGDLAIDLERWLEGRPIIARRVSPPVRAWRWAKRNPKLATATLTAFCSASAAALLFFSRYGSPPQSGLDLRLPPEKSIAVLPFENLSREPDNAYFADAIQDEILTRLSKISDLKVISRTSTAKYHSKPDNLRKIAQELGVSTILEGAVQKAGDKVRVNVQLIKAASDSHIWADTFDRKVTDIFSVESEVAKAIADQLQAKLTGEEEQVIAAKPTDNAAAYDAYLRGLAYSLKTANTAANALNAQKYLKEAVRLDPKFALAWALLSFVDARGYRTQFLQPTAALRDEARQAAETAFTLQPNLGEAVLAKGFYHYACLRDYDTAVRYFEQARPLLPNNSRIPESLAYVTRKQGQWDRSESYFNEAERLDPRNVSLLTQHALSYKDRRLFPEALRKLEQILNITPDDVDTIVEKAVIAQAEGDLPRASSLLAPLHLPADDANALETQVYQVILERSPAPVILRLKEILAKPDPGLGYANGELRFWLGWAQEVSGDHAAARESWRQASGELESFVKEQPENHTLLGDLALTHAALGDKAPAFALAEQAMAAVPIEKDAVSGPTSIEILARVAAQLGEADRAIAALQKLMTTPYAGALGPGAPLTPALLRLDPMFDPLRNDPRFQKLAAADSTSSSAQAEIPEKSIAVLPFENRSRDPDNAFFTDGVQDEILTDLARIAALKVISRNSVMQYQSGVKRNLRQIANELRVAHVVEGSVQRAGNRVRVNAQLIDARNDAHLWAQTYDRDLADVFAIQSEIAKAIADQLQAKLSPNEKSEIEQPPTIDVTAFDFYSHAKNLLLNASGSSTGKPDLLQAADLLNQAVARDPSFFEAYCQLAFAQASLYFFDFDRTPSRLAAAEAAVQTAARLRPDAGETHLARARNLYWGHSDYDGALAELEIARQRLPSDNWVFSLKGYIERRQGRWEESLRDLERAIALDPRNILTLQQTARSYTLLHRYAESKSLLARVLSFEPNDPVTKVLHAFVELDSNANARSVLEVIDSIRRTNPAALPNVANNWLICSLAERDIAAAKQALAACGENPILLGSNENVIFPRSFAEGVIARMNHDDEKARAAFAAAHAEQEKIVQAHPNYGPALCVLGLIDAGLGRKEQALREGRRAVELVRAEKDAVLGATTIKYLAMIAAWVGDTDLACNQLAMLIRAPSGVSYGQLKLMPFWDPLRGDRRFEKILEKAKEPVAGELVATPVPAKSIAVLPFENLSRDPDNAYFAEGVQDEILTRLSKIADLKVISRTSTRQYKSAPPNVPDIAKQLGVAFIVEGSVQKRGDAVRVNVQLIKAANDTHVWADTFDRKLTDTFSVESEVAKAIADQLGAKLTGQEKQVIAGKPTDNPEAYDAYLRGLAYSLKPANTTANSLGAQRYLREAVRLDPKFARAWALLSSVDSLGYLTKTLQPTVALREEARQAAETALSLEPNLGEALLAKGYYHYGCLKDYDAAIRYFDQARQILPNDSRIPESLAYVTRRRGEWERSETYFNEAERLDPRNPNLLTQHAVSLMRLRRLPEALRKLDQVLNITPDDVRTVAFKAGITQAQGDLPRAAALLAPLHPNADDAGTLETQVYQAILERNPAAIIPKLEEILEKPDPELGYFNSDLRYWLGWAQDLAGDHVAAEKSWQQARSELELFLKDQPDNFNVLTDLALTNMGLGDKAAALAFAERAIAANPIQKDAISGPSGIETLARVAAQTGEPDRAIDALRKLLSIPALTDTAAPFTADLLRLDPMFDPL